MAEVVAEEVAEEAVVAEEVVMLVLVLVAPVDVRQRRRWRRVLAAAYAAPPRLTRADPSPDARWSLSG